MKKIVLAITALFAMASCDPTTEPTTPENVVSGLITEGRYLVC